MKIKVKAQPRQSLAMKVTPTGLEVLIPDTLPADSEQVQNFIAAGLDKLRPLPSIPSPECLGKDEILARVDLWAERLGVRVQRVQFQPMRRKWGSISTAGNLTLANDLIDLPRHLVDYVICHELLHLRVAHHNRLYYLLLDYHISAWRNYEQELGCWTLALGRSEGS